MITQGNWKAMPMLGSPLWGVKDDKGVIIALGLAEDIARLIAATPNLLAACEAARAFIRKLEKKYTPELIEPNSNSGLNWDIRGTLNAAIAKAQGSTTTDEKITPP